MFTLKVGEMLEFEERAGVSFASMSKGMQAKVCKPHRLAIGACKGCQKASGFCGDHTIAFQECDACEGAELPMKTALTLAFLLKRRGEPGLTWETFAAETDAEEALGYLKNI